MRQLLTHEIGRLSPDDFKAQKRQPVRLVLDNIRSGHNVGSAFRTADAFAIEGIDLCGITPRPPHREIHKTALGATDTIPWESYEDTLTCLAKLKAQGYKIAAVEITDSPVLLQDFQPAAEEKYAFVFGNEMRGIAPEALEVSDFALEVPQFGTKHSLNVSVTMGVILWDFLFKRNFS